MITHYFRTLKDERLKEVSDVRTGVWTHVVSPGEVEIENLIKDFGLDRSIVADVQDLFEVPRFERSASIAYFFARYPYDDKDEDIDTAPLLIVMGESFVLTIAQRKVPFIEALIKKGEIITTKKTNLFIHIMSGLTKSFDTELVRMRKAVHKDRVRLQNIGTNDIARLVGYEHALNEAIAAIIPTNAWLQQLTAGHHMQLFSDDVEMMQDLMIANSQLVDSSKMLLKTIQNVRGATEAILTQNLNNTIKLLTALTIILTVPTVVSSLYGMNVSLPLADNANAFWAILVLIFALVALMVYYFAKKL
jgi:magnesium transporter